MIFWLLPGRRLMRTRCVTLRRAEGVKRTGTGPAVESTPARSAWQPALPGSRRPVIGRGGWQVRAAVARPGDDSALSCAERSVASRD